MLAAMRRARVSDGVPQPIARAAAVAALVAVLGVPAIASAKPPQRELVIGVGAHLAAALGNTCKQDGDVDSCTDFVPFGGADLTAQYWLGELLALGARVAGSKDLDGAEGTDSSGLTWDPEDQWLWRLAAELRLDPPLLPEGLWIGGQAGLALLNESWESPDSARSVREDAESRAAPLLGLAVGWDFWLGRSLTLAPEVRGELIFFGDPPELMQGVEGRDYGSSAWLDLSLRLSYVF
jgi:hypothetical protein